MYVSFVSLAYIKVTVKPTTWRTQHFFCQKYISLSKPSNVFFAANHKTWPKLMEAQNGHSIQRHPIREPHSLRHRGFCSDLSDGLRRTGSCPKSWSVVKTSLTPSWIKQWSRWFNKSPNYWDFIMMGILTYYNLLAMDGVLDLLCSLQRV